MTRGALFLLVLTIGIAAVIFVPILSIWAVNTLFALSIPYTIKTWFAALVVIGILKGNLDLSVKTS